MFSNDINASDLYFSNPTDHFLLQDREIKTSFESGFSSSYNQTGRSKELPYRNSQDLFNSERTESPFMVCNSDYQKYITQNLLIGSGETSVRSISPAVGKSGVKKEKHLQSSQNGFQEYEMKDIRMTLETLSDNVRKLATEVSLQRNNMLDEVSKLKEKVLLTEKTIGQKIEAIDENYKILIKLMKNEETVNKQLYDKINKTSESVSDIKSKLDDFNEERDKVMHENIKIFKNYEMMNKKQLQQIHNICSQTDSTVVENMNRLLKSSFQDIRNNFDEKLNSLKSYMNNLQIQPASSHDISERKASMYGETLIPNRKRRNEPKDITENTSFKKPVMRPSSDLNFKYRNNAISSQNSKTISTKPTKHLTHTPLACYISNVKSNEENRDVYKTKSNFCTDFSEFEDKMSDTNLKIKRKICKPPFKSDSPIHKNTIKKTRNLYCTPLAKTIMQNNTDNFKTHFLRKQSNILTASFSSSFNNTDSPVITVYQASTLAKGYISKRR